MDRAKRIGKLTYLLQILFYKFIRKKWNQFLISIA